jgi:hypothetical protein
LRIGDAQHVDLVRYVAWLVQVRHAPRTGQAIAAPATPDLAEAAQGAAAFASRREQLRGQGQKLTAKQEALIAALLTEPTYAAAATKAGIREATLYRWLQLPTFRAAYRQARRALVEAAVGRLQDATGQAVARLVAVASQGRRDGDRVRAAIALLDHAWRGLANADVLHGEPGDAGNAAPMDTNAVVELLASRLRQIDAAELPTVEKARLTAALADALLRAIGVDVMDQRLQALQAVLRERKDKRR